MDLRKFPKSLTSKEIAEYLGRIHLGVSQDIDAVSDFELASASHLFFQTGNTKLKLVPGATSIVPDSNESIDSIEQAFILSPDPRLDFARIVDHFLKKNWLSTEENQYYSSSVDLDEDVKIGYGTVLEKGVVIGCGSVLGSNVVIKAGVRIGQDCIISDGAIIGNDGLTIARDSHGQTVPFRHVGELIISDNVEIGPNATIGRATLGRAVIEKAVIIGPQVNVGHNGHIRENAIITGCSCISGGVDVGERTWIGANCTIMQKVSIGNDCTIGIGAVVTKSVANGVTLSGLPAMSLRELQTMRRMAFSNK